MRSKVHLLDVNVWVALTMESHMHHTLAKNWTDSIGASPLLFCRNTQQGFLRIITSVKIFREEALSMASAWSVYDQFLLNSRISFVAEPSGLEAEWKSFTNQESQSSKLWNDAYLAAFARVSQLTMVTFDQGFIQFSLPDLIILSQ
jgi:uncharacterized protein